jgi:hypothetical protein
MRIISASIVAASVLLICLIGALPAASQSVQPTPPIASPAGAEADWKSQRDAYVQKARDEVQEWQRQLQDLREKRRAKNLEADITTKNDFHTAWIETEDAFHKLETVGANDWESAKTSYNKASLKLAAIWEKIKT